MNKEETNSQCGCYLDMCEDHYDKDRREELLKELWRTTNLTCKEGFIKLIGEQLPKLKDNQLRHFYNLFDKLINKQPTKKLSKSDLQES